MPTAQAVSVWGAYCGASEVFRGEMEGAKQMACAIKQVTIRTEKLDEAQLVYNNAQDKVIALAKQGGLPVNNYTAAKYAALEKLEQALAALDQARKLVHDAFMQGCIPGIKDRTATDDAMSAAWAEVSQAETALESARFWVVHAARNEFRAAKNDMAANAPTSTRNVRACNGKGVQLYKNMPK